MPCVMRVDGFVFYIYQNDHRLAHVHVCKAGAWCTIRLGDGDEPPSLLEQGEMRPIDARRAVWLATGSWELLLAQWRKLHGQPDA